MESVLSSAAFAAVQTIESARNSFRREVSVFAQAALEQSRKVANNLSRLSIGMNGSLFMRHWSDEWRCERCRAPIAALAKFQICRFSLNRTSSCTVPAGSPVKFRDHPAEASAPLQRG